MAYTLAWAPIVRHSSGWVVPQDIWGTYRSGHYIVWGDIGDLYSAATGLVTFPGIALVLAPFAAFTGALHLSESFPFSVAHPTAWLVLGPVSLALGSTALIPIDMLAAHLGATGRSRRVLAVAGGVVLWPVLVIWGHPEDALAIAFGVASLLTALRGRWRAGGWLLGAAVAFQPLVILMVPVMVLGVVPNVRERLKYLVRGALPSLILLVIPLAQSWGATTRSLLQQPNFPQVDHPTPWLFLAPVLRHAHVSSGLRGITFHNGTYGTGLSQVHGGEIVAAGPGRTIALVLACVIGLWAWRVRPRPETVVWLIGLCLALRCVFESVMVPFYLWPPLALLLLSAAAIGGWRLWATVIAAVAVSVYSEHYFSTWVWFGPTILLLAIAVAGAWPMPVSRSRQTPPAEVSS